MVEIVERVLSQMRPSLADETVAKQRFILNKNISDKDVSLLAYLLLYLIPV